MNAQALDLFVRVLFLPTVLVVASWRLWREIVVFIRECKVHPTHPEHAASGPMAPPSSAGPDAAVPSD